MATSPGPVFTRIRAENRPPAGEPSPPKSAENALPVPRRSPPLAWRHVWRASLVDESDVINALARRAAQADADGGAA